MTSTEEHAEAYGWMETYTGLRVTPFSLWPSMIDIRDIAHALSLIPRFGGHSATLMSVAEHSVEVSYMVPGFMSLTALLHDASEAYLGDMIRPLKRLPEMEAYRAAEERAHWAISLRFGTLYPHPPEVIAADVERLRYEIAEIRHVERFGDKTYPDMIERLFLSRFTHLDRLPR